MGKVKEINDKIERLQNISLLREMRDDLGAMTRIAALFTTISISSGKPVIRENDEGDELFVIKSGTVSIEKRTMQDDFYTVTELKAGDNIFFGEVALLDPDKRSATVMCKTNCEFYVLTRPDFLHFGNENPKYGLAITRELSRILCKRLRKANTDIITLFDALVEEMAESGGLAE
ncbi:MAG: cyclic nucleotide-binding domain-containing protein [Chitinivibrionales bacterium]|nr:cyclic nucleotide-binding domain-containing protein [Chitinivibrionales bacterium]